MAVGPRLALGEEPPYKNKLACEGHKSDQQPRAIPTYIVQAADANRQKREQCYQYDQGRHWTDMSDRELCKEIRIG